MEDQLTAPLIPAPQYFVQAQAHFRAGRHREAGDVLRQALQVHPGDSDLWNLAAAVAGKTGDAELSERSLRKVVALAPDFVEGYFNLGAFLHNCGRLQEAVEAYRETLRRAPRHIKAFNNLGHALLKLDLPEEALLCWQGAAAATPEVAIAHHNLGTAYAYLGRIEEAVQSTRKAIALAPADERAQYCRSLAFIKDFSRDDPDLAPMEALAQNLSALSAESQAMLQFALGKAYADLGERERSFRHVLAGNRGLRQRSGYDEAATLARIERIGQVFTPALLRARAGAGQPSRIPVFILGMPRSGSTLVEQILASHPQVHGAGECGEFRWLAEMLRLPDGTPALFEGVPRLGDSELQRLGGAYLERLRARAPQAGRISDKTLGNFLYAGLIHLALPEAKFIHCRRDPVDTCLSCFSHPFSNNYPYACDLGELGRYWRAYDRLMRHWREVLPPGAMLELEYEALVDDLEGQSRRMLDHCGLEWNDACLSFHQTERAVRTSSLTQVRRPIFRSSVQKWRAYGESLRPLLDALGDAVAEQPGPA